MDITLPPSAKPQLLRASHEWCTEQGYAPYLLVAVDGTVNVPKEYVKDGQIVLNTSFDATAALQLGNEFITFKARFGGVPREIFVPVGRVVGLFARETGQGVYFDLSESSSEVADASGPVVQGLGDGVKPNDQNAGSDDAPPPKGGGGRPVLVRVK